MDALPPKIDVPAEVRLLDGSCTRERPCVRADARHEHHEDEHAPESGDPTPDAGVPPVQHLVVAPDLVHPRDEGYVWQWAESTFENWQSEFLQIFVFIVLTTILVHRKSHESPDTDYDTEAALRRIEAKVDALERKVAKA